jgi:hypothetical protein
VAQLEELPLGARRRAERLEAALDVEDAEHHVADEQAARGRGEAAGPDLVGLDLPDVVEQRAGGDEVEVGAGAPPWPR